MRRARACLGRRVSMWLSASALVYLIGCGESPESGGEPRPNPAPPANSDEGPVRLSYVCGNRFLITNAYSVPVSVTYRVTGTGEEGAENLAAGPDLDPAFSERMIETRAVGAVELYLNGRLLVSRDNDGTPCTPTTPAPAILSDNTSLSGQWTAPFNWPVVALHVSLLPNGKVLAFGHGGTPQLWNPSTGGFTAVPSPALLFCSGHTLLADGRVLMAGGHISNDHGLRNITYFSSSTGGWSSGTPMARGRWYPTVTTMANGDVVIIAGNDEAGATVEIPEVWSNGSVRRLTNAAYRLAYYPRGFLAPNGKLLVVGVARASRYLSLTGNGSWSNLNSRKYGTRDYGSAVMYDDGKILYVGGGRTTNTAETLDLNAASPSWQWTGSMAYPRRHLNATVLPTGEVLVTGGVSGTGFNDVNTGVHAAEIWNPSTGQWTTLASNIVTRGYHSASLLLPDGRVLHSGSGDGAGAPQQLNAEIFSPPYLFRGPRPSIQSAPASLSYGASFSVETADAASIAKVSLIRLGSVTHAFDMNQRYQALSFSRSANALTVSGPGNRNRTPPGHYMLFIVNGDGVPSIAKIVKVK
jgi:galactose oxidase-like protein/Kelch motif protein